MSRFHSYISTALKLISSYDGKAPFSFHIKNYFRSEKKHGSRDRNLISTLCYSYFRTSQAFAHEDLQAILPKAWFLCNDYDPGFLDEFPELKNSISADARQKLHKLGLTSRDLFPFHELLSDQLDKDEFAFSILIQPDLFIRTRPGKKHVVSEKLEGAAIPFREEGKNAFRLGNKTSLEKLIHPDREAVVQDLNSQQVLNDLSKESRTLNRQVLSVWDCCAASGGKSILASDIFDQTLSLTVSDIRRSILTNLEERFSRAGIPVELSIVADLENNKLPDIGEYDIIICDAPCTGSGTWSRTPEQLRTFEISCLDHYSRRQELITRNASRLLKPGGLFCYITCSVFEAENEKITKLISSFEGMSLITEKYLKGYDKKADTMYTSVFRKKS